MPRKRRPPAAAPPGEVTDRAARVEELAREVLRLLRSDPRAALATADQMVALANGDARLNARASWSRAHALSNLSRYCEACDHYHAAATAYHPGLAISSDAIVGEVEQFWWAYGEYTWVDVAGQRAEYERLGYVRLMHWQYAPVLYLDFYAWPGTLPAGAMPVV